MEALCEELQRWVGTLGPILAHMHAYQEFNPVADHAPPIPDVLHSLLAGTLTPLGERYGDDRVAEATELLREAGMVVAGEIYLVAPDAMEEMTRPRPRSRPRRRGRR